MSASELLENPQKSIVDLEMGFFYAILTQEGTNANNVGKEDLL